MDRDTIVQEDDAVFGFDKFMDSILLEESRVRQEHAPAQEAPQRMHARRRRERPLQRIVMRSAAVL
jgi:hypothetical protein